MSWSMAMPLTTRRARGAWLTSFLDERLDMVVGNRIDQEVAAYRAGHPRRQLAADLVGCLDCRGPPSATCCRAIGCSRAASSSRSRCCPARFEIETELVDSVRSNWDCRSPRSTRPIMRGRKARFPSSAPGATVSAFCGPIPQLYRSERPLIIFRRLRFSAGGRFNRPGRADYRHVRGNAHGAASADRRAVDGPDADGVPVLFGRACARYGDAWPPRKLKLLAYLALRAPGGRAAQKLTCARSSAPTT